VFTRSSKRPANVQQLARVLQHAPTGKQGLYSKSRSKSQRSLRPICLCP